MKTENIHNLVKSNDAEYDNEAPSFLYIPSYAMESIKRRAKGLQSACLLVNATSIEDYEWDNGIIELDDDNTEMSSGYQFYLRVWKSGSYDLVGYSKYNDDARVTAHLGSLSEPETNVGVSFTLSDGDKKLPVRVAYNGAVASGELLIYSETNFGGAPNAPIGILLTDGKLDVRVWQPSDMGTDPTSVTVVEHYGVYEVETLACNLKEIGSEKDYDQLFRQKGFDNGEVAATAKIDVDGETYDIVIGVVGDQEVYANYAENEDGDDVLVPLDEDGTQKRLRREPNEFMRAKTFESESNQAYLAWSANCWLNIEILKNGESVGSFYDVFGSVYGSIQECLEAVCEDNIRQMLGDETEINEKGPFYNIRFAEGVDLETKCDVVSGMYSPYRTVAWANYKMDGEEYEIHVFIDRENRFVFDVSLGDEHYAQSSDGVSYITAQECLDAIKMKGLVALRVETKMRQARKVEPSGEEFCKKNHKGLEEGCPYCDATVELEYMFYAQPCPECGEMMLPCNDCPYMDSDTYLPEMCADCPIASQKEDIGIKRFMILSSDQRLELMKKLGVEELKVSESFKACFEYLKLLEVPSQKELDEALGDARSGYYLGILGAEELWETLNNHKLIYPYENSFDYYDTEWFEENKNQFIDFMKQVIVRETLKSAGV